MKRRRWRRRRRRRRPAHLLRDAAGADEQQVLQVGVEEGGAHHGHAHTLPHDEAHRAVVRETDLCRRLLEPGAAETQTTSFPSDFGIRGQPKGSLIGWDSCTAVGGAWRSWEFDVFRRPLKQMSDWPRR